MEQATPMITTATRLPLNDYARVVELAQDRGLVTRSGRPNVSAAIRELVVQALDADQEQHREATNDD